MYRTKESPDFSASRKGLNSIARADEAVKGLLWAISNKPDDFPVLVETERLRLAKSEKLTGPKDRHVILYVWFAVNGADEIDLLELEVVPVPAVPYLM